MDTPKLCALCHLPSECLENVLEELDLQSIKNLRLSSKKLARRCLGPRFKSFVEDQTTDLTYESLQSLSELSGHGLGKSVKRLTVTAAVYDTTGVEEVLATGMRSETTYAGLLSKQVFRDCTEAELAEVQSDLSWVKAKREQQAQDSTELIVDRLAAVTTRFAHLQRVKLDAIVIWGPLVTVTTERGDVREIWARASQVCRLVMAAIARSGLIIDSLSLYRDTPRCGILVDDLEAISSTLRSDGLTSARLSVKTLAITIGPDFDLRTEQASTTRGRIREDDQAHVSDESNDEYPALADLLMSMPNLEAVDLKMYRTRNGDIGVLGKMLQAAVKRVHLQALQRCALAGISTDERSLQQFLQRHPSIKELEFAEIRLGESGSWANVFTFLRADLPDLQSLHISNLWGRSLANLDPDWESSTVEKNKREWSYPCKGGRMVYTLVLEGEELGRELRFRPAPVGRALGSGQHWRWHNQRKATYGPP